MREINDWIEKIETTGIDIAKITRWMKELNPELQEAFVISQFEKELRKAIEEIPVLESILKTTKVHTQEELENTIYENLTTIKKHLTSIKEIVDLEAHPLMKPAHSIQELEIIPTKKLRR